jgi:hypothetical protein
MHGCASAVFTQCYQGIHVQVLQLMHVHGMTWLPVLPPFTAACVYCLQLESGGGSSTKLGMPCTTCLHPTCKHSPAQQGVLACPECR